VDVVERELDLAEPVLVDVGGVDVVLSRRDGRRKFVGVYFPITATQIGKNVPTPLTLQNLEHAIRRQLRTSGLFAPYSLIPPTHG